MADSPSVGSSIGEARAGEHLCILASVLVWREVGAALVARSQSGRMDRSVGSWSARL